MALLTINLFSNDVFKEGWICGGFGIHGSGSLLGGSAVEDIFDVFGHGVFHCLCFVAFKLLVQQRLLP